MTAPGSAELKEKEHSFEKGESISRNKPNVGHRGCRLGLVYPEIYEMQAKAIFNAVITLTEKGITVKPEIMIPLVGHVNELKIMRELVIDIADQSERRNMELISTI